MKKIYEPIGWEDFPSEKTPISSENLGKMDLAINEIDSRVVEHEHNKLSKEESDNRYANAIKRTYSGETIVATDSSGVHLEGLRVLGRSEQVSTTGKNLLPYPYAQSTKTMNGITFTDNGDGSVTVNGTSTGYASMVLYTGDAAFSGCYLSGTPSGGGASTAYLRADTADDIMYRAGTTGVKVESDVVTVSIIVSSADITVNNLTFYPQLEFGTVATEYEPYTGGKASPSPAYPQPIKSVGDNGSVDVGVYGRNAVKPAVTTLTQNGLTVTVDENGVITANGTLTANTSFIVGKYKLPLKCKLRLFMENRPLNTIYAITTDNEGNNQGAYSGSNWISGVFIGSETERNVQIVFIAATYTNFKAKIIVAADTDEWEPYKESQSLITSTPNGLPGIKVKKAEYATYKDKNGVKWVSDEIDFAKCKYVHRVKKVTPTLVGGGYHTNGNYYVVVNVDNKVYTIVASMCSKAINGRDTDFMYSDGYYYENSSNFVFNGTADDTLETMREKFNGMELLYILAEPIEEPLSTSEIEAYKALTSNYPTTTILNDENAYVEATLVADTKNHIEQNYVPKSEFLSVVDRVSALEQKALA